jgi:hypothetical protein
LLMAQLSTSLRSSASNFERVSWKRHPVKSTS